MSNKNAPTMIEKSNPKNHEILEKRKKESLDLLDGIENVLSKHKDYKETGIHSVHYGAIVEMIDHKKRKKLHLSEGAVDMIHMTHEKLKEKGLI